MNDFTIINILDMLNAIGEDNVNIILSGFSCPKNKEIEDFVKNNAIDFAKRKMSVTYLVMDSDGKPAAIYALTHKAINIKDEILSSTLRKRIRRFAQLDEETNTYMVSAFLIAQF